MRALPFLLLLTLALPACDSLPDSGTAGEVVVEAYLVAGQPLPMITLRRSVPFGGESNTGIRDAQVRVELLREDGSVEAVQRYNTYVDQGTYGYTWNGSTSPMSVLPLRRYRLVAEVPGTGTVRAETLVPGAFDLLHASADTLVYQGDDQLTFTVSRSAYPGRNSIFVFSTESLRNPLTLRDAVPFIRGFLDRNNDGVIDEEIDDFTLEDLRLGSSPLLNEANYEVGPGGTLTIRLPWIAVAFLGPNRISVNAVDDNLNDFLRSADVQQGGGTSSPGEILNILDHVDNGTGVFGSYARVSRDVFIRE